MQDKKYIYLIQNHEIMGLKDIFKTVNVNEAIKDGKEVVKTLSSKEQGTRRLEVDMMLSLIHI